jgi:hypothetical protein
MAKIKFFNDTLHIISALKADEIKRRKDFGDNLTLKDKDDKEVFKIAYAPHCKESFTKYGITYTGTTTDGYACASIKTNEPLTSEKIVKMCGEAIRNLNLFEDMIKNDTSFENVIARTEASIEEITFFNDTTEETEEETTSGTYQSPDEE